MSDSPRRRMAALPEVPGGRTSPDLLARAEHARELRHAMTSASLPADLFVDPAWDMMLELMIADGGPVPLVVKDLILLSGESPASAMRRIARLEEADLVQRRPDPADHRRVRVFLTDKGHAAMAAMLERLFDLGPAREETATPLTFRPHRRG